MRTNIDYYLSMASPWCYLGHARLQEIANKYAATITLLPVSFADIFPKTGGLPLPQRPPARLANRLQELRRWRDVTGVPLNLQPKFHPYPDMLANQAVIAADLNAENAFALAGALMRATFAEERNLGDRTELQEVITAAGFDGRALIDTAENHGEVHARYTANTEKALTANVFGAPTYVIGDELFWGQDRLDFVQRHLAAGMSSS